MSRPFAINCITMLCLGVRFETTDVNLSPTRIYLDHSLLWYDRIIKPDSSKIPVDMHEKRINVVSCHLCMKCHDSNFEKITSRHVMFEQHIISRLISIIT